MRYAIVVLWVCLASIGQADEPLHVLEKWTTTDGKTAEAAFQSIDEAAGTVTILVPRTIELSRLDDASRDLAKRFGAKPPASIEDVPIAVNFGLNDPTVKDWLASTESQRVATAGNLLLVLLARDKLTAEMKHELTSVIGFNGAALTLSRASTKVMASLDQNTFQNDRAMEVIIGLMSAAGHLQKEISGN
jgi:hypothetical protein